MPQPETPWPEVVSAAVHEMRSPLNVVSGFLNLLLGGHGGTLTPVQRQAVEAAGTSAARLNELLTTLSELARLSSGRLSPAQDHVPVGLLLQDTASRFVPPLDLAVRCLVAGDVPHVRVVADRQRMPRALASLAAAVARAHPGSPAVFLRASVQGDHVALTFSVAETTTEPADLDALAPLPGAQAGLGLGLPLAHLLVTRAGGRLGVPSAGAADGQLAVILPLR